jgi:predicted GNAT family acetyltransferase
MLRKLTEDDRQAALSYLALEPSYNVFTIGDIENFGFSNEFQDVWGDFDERSEYRALVLRYYNNHIVYSAAEDFGISAVCEVLGSWRDEWMLSGKESTVAPLAARLGLDDIRRQFLAELRSAGDLPVAPADTGVEWATLVTFEKVIDFQRGIEEFVVLTGSAEAIRHNIESGTGRTVFVRRGSEAVSCASSAAENSRSAMIIGVCTAKAYRSQGLATSCMTHLCRFLLDEGKVVCLFYENPTAGRIYKRLGFRDVGRWAIAKRRKE